MNTKITNARAAFNNAERDYYPSDHPDVPSTYGVWWTTLLRDSLRQHLAEIRNRLASHAPGERPLPLLIREREIIAELGRLRSWR